MPLFTILLGILGVLGGAAIFVLLWDKYRDKIREWNVARNVPASFLSRAVVYIDGHVTSLRARVRVRRKDAYYDEDIYEETLSDEQIEALKQDRPHLFRDTSYVSLEEDILSNL